MVGAILGSYTHPGPENSGGLTGLYAQAVVPSTTMTVYSVGISFKTAPGAGTITAGIASGVAASPPWIGKGTITTTAGTSAGSTATCDLDVVTTMTAGTTYYVTISTDQPRGNALAHGTYSTLAISGFTNGTGNKGGNMYYQTGYGSIDTNYRLLFNVYGAAAPTLVATVDTLAKTVSLTVTGSTGAITVKRYVGGVGTAVRGTFANGRTVLDYDAPLNTDLVYIATDTVGSSAQQPARIDSDTAMLSTMNSPVLSAPVLVLADDNQTYVGASVAHKVLGTNAPLVTVEPPAYRSGTYRFLCRTVDDWLQLRQLLQTGGVMLLRSECPTEYLDTAFILTGGSIQIAWSSLPARQRVVEIDYQAVAPDTTPAQEYAWTWADVPVTYATWADVVAAQPTWADLATYVP